MHAPIYVSRAIKPFEAKQKQISIHATNKLSQKAEGIVPDSKSNKKKKSTHTFSQGPKKYKFTGRSMFFVEDMARKKITGIEIKY